MSTELTSNKRKETDIASDSDDFDMFASTDDENVELNNNKLVKKVETKTKRTKRLEVDDAEGYYLIKNGDSFGKFFQYTVINSLGRGVFSTVCLCKDSRKARTVAVKMIRNNASMKRSALREKKILEKINSLDVKNSFIVELLDTFDFGQHLCLVFHPFKMNLREVLHQFGKNVGLNINAVKVYAKQLLTGLKYLDKLNIIHADLKLDNILVTEKMGLVKICDFGSALFADDPSLEPTPYLVSRYYRAPEVILGVKYTKKVDIWSLGCCLFEILSGKVMFPGETNNLMLKLMQKVKGKVPNKLVKKHLNSYLFLNRLPHFDPSTFEFVEFIWNEKEETLATKKINILEKNKTTVYQLMINNSKKGNNEREVRSFCTVLEQCTTLDPKKRISPEKALTLEFFQQNSNDKKLQNN